MKFPRRTRLTTRTQFTRVFDRPAVSSDRCFRILSRPNELNHCRLGMAISRKSCRQASGRSRIKRIVRESFRHHQDQLSQLGGLDLVVLSTGQAGSICNSGLFASLQAHWDRIAARRASNQNRNES